MTNLSLLKTGNNKQRLFGNWNAQFVLHIHDLSFDRKILMSFFLFVYYRILDNDSTDWKD